MHIPTPRSILQKTLTSSNWKRSRRKFISPKIKKRAGAEDGLEHLQAYGFNASMHLSLSLYCVNLPTLCMCTSVDKQTVCRGMLEAQLLKRHARQIAYPYTHKNKKKCQIPFQGVLKGVLSILGKGRGSLAQESLNGLRWERVSFTSFSFFTKNIIIPLAIIFHKQMSPLPLLLQGDWMHRESCECWQDQ